MKRVLVIGGSSFVARNIVQYFSKDYVFKTVTRNYTGYSNEVLIDDYFELNSSIFQDIDIVINCAAIVHQPTISDIKIYDRVNYELPIYLAKIAKEARVKQFLQLSTIAVYGLVDQISIETIECPVNPYGISKLKADQALIKMSTDSFNVICIRPPMIYGGGNAPGNMMRLIELVDKKIPLPFGNALSQRDFIFIKTLVNYCHRSLELNKSNIYIVKDSFSVSTKELVMIIAEKLQVKTPLFSVPLFLLKLLKKIKPSIFEKLFGHSSLTSNFEDSINSTKNDLEQGIQEMVEYYRGKQL